MVAITLGAVSLDEAQTTVSEKLEELGGRDARTITLSGVIAGAHSVAEIEARLDALLAAVSDEACETALSVRSGRRLWVRREKLTRDVAPESLLGTFVLTLAAADPFEEAVEASLVAWAVSLSGATIEVSSGGTAPAQVKIAMTAAGMVVNPSFSDGTRCIQYSGLVVNGESLVFDGLAGMVTLDGRDVTPYTSGLFPCVTPDATVLTYADDAASDHTASVTIEWRERWY